MCVCVAVYATVMLLWCALSVFTLSAHHNSCVETCRSTLFVISTIIVTYIYVHSLVELKILLGKLVAPLRILYCSAKSEVFTPMLKKIQAFWNVMWRRVVKSHRHYENATLLLGLPDPENGDTSPLRLEVKTPTT